SQDAQTAPAAKVPLNGGVMRSEFRNQAEQDSNQRSGGVVDLRNEQPKFHLFGHKHQLSAEDYRSLEFGITGFQSVKTLIGRYPFVVKVFHDLPAEAAGIRPGDKVIRANDHEFTQRDAQPEVWKYLDGRAGTPVDVTVERHKEILTFRLIRMNIEDIQNPH